MFKAELLPFAPVPGTCPEKAFDSSGNALWVRFTDANGIEWCAMFGCASTPCREVIFPGAGACCLVIADGKGYWVDVDRRRLLSRSTSAYLTAAKAVPGQELVAACDYTNIYLLGPDGKRWDSGRVSTFGISMESIDARQLKGRVNDMTDDSTEFRLYFSGPTFECAFSPLELGVA